MGKSFTRLRTVAPDTPMAWSTSCSSPPSLLSPAILKSCRYPDFPKWKLYIYIFICLKSFRYQNTAFGYLQPAFDIFISHVSMIQDILWVKYFISVSGAKTVAPSTRQSLGRNLYLSFLSSYWLTAQLNFPFLPEPKPETRRAANQNTTTARGPILPQLSDTFHSEPVT